MINEVLPECEVVLEGVSLLLDLVLLELQVLDAILGIHF